MLWIGVIALTGHFVEAFELGKSRQANMELNFENPIMEKYLYSKFGGEQKSKAVSKVGKLPAGQNEVDGFIVASYYNDAECSGTVAGITSGTAVGVCYTVTDLNDNSTYGVTFRYESEMNGLLYLTALEYSDSECLNYVRGNPFPVVEGCDSFNEGWTSVVYTTDKTPWDQLPPGAFLLYYDTMDHCKEGGVYGQFVHYTLNYCFAGSHDMLTQCSEGKFTLSTYSDDVCSDLESTYTTALSRCKLVEYDDNDDDATTTTKIYSTGECKEMW